MNWIGARAESGWSLLSDGYGIPQATATMIIPVLYQTPAQTNWEMAAVLMIVKYIQLKFSEYGERTTPDGYLDGNTIRLIDKYVGPGWRQRDWYSVLQQILKNRVTRPVFHRKNISLHLGAYEDLGEAETSIVFYWDGVIARPGNAASLSLAKSIQERNKVKQDGEIGPATHKAYNARNHSSPKTIKEIIAIYDDSVKFVNGKPPWYGKSGQGTIYNAAAAGINVGTPGLDLATKTKFDPMAWISRQPTTTKAAMGIGAGLVVAMLMRRGRRK